MQLVSLVFTQNILGPASWNHAITRRGYDTRDTSPPISITSVCM